MRAISISGCYGVRIPSILIGTQGSDQEVLERSTLSHFEILQKKTDTMRPGALKESPKPRLEWCPPGNCLEDHGKHQTLNLGVPDGSGKAPLREKYYKVNRPQQSAVVLA